MNDDDLEQVWKESVVVCFEVISCYLFEYTKNITETRSKRQVSRPRSKLRAWKVEAVGLTKPPGREVGTHQNGMYKRTKFISRITSVQYNTLHRPRRVNTKTRVKTKFKNDFIRSASQMKTV